MLRWSRYSPLFTTYHASSSMRNRSSVWVPTPPRRFLTRVPSDRTCSTVSCTPTCCISWSCMVDPSCPWATWTTSSSRLWRRDRKRDKRWAREEEMDISRISRWFLWWSSSYSCSARPQHLWTTYCGRRSTKTTESAASGITTTRPYRTCWPYWTPASISSSTSSRLASSVSYWWRRVRIRMLFRWFRSSRVASRRRPLPSRPTWSRTRRLSTDKCNYIQLLPTVAAPNATLRAKKRMWCNRHEDRFWTPLE